MGEATWFVTIELVGLIRPLVVTLQRSAELGNLDELIETAYTNLSPDEKATVDRWDREDGLSDAGLGEVPGDWRN